MREIQEKRSLIALLSIVFFILFSSISSLSPPGIREKLSEDGFNYYKFSPKISDSFFYDELRVGDGEIYVTDANNDGYNDIFVGHWYSNRITIVIWDPDIGYWESPIIKRTLHNTGRIVVEDVNDDGKKDIITTTFLGYLQILLWNNTLGDWNWEYPIVKNTSGKLVVGDVNNDTINEIIVLGDTWFHIYIWNQESEDWDKESKSPAQTDIIVGDVNNDGVNEIITSNWNPSRLEFFFWNQTKGTWDRVSKLLNDPSTPTVYHLSLGDVNNDGYNDIIFSTMFNDYNVGILTWNHTNGDWNNLVMKNFPIEPIRVGNGDVNNDGFNDIVVQHFNAYSLLCWDNNSKDWDLTTSDRYGNSETKGVVFSDINNDGLIDFILAYSTKLLLFLRYYTIDSPILEPIVPHINYHNKSVELNWSDIPRAYSYYIYRDKKPITLINNRDHIATVSQSNYTDHVPFNGKYYYAITAGDSFTCSQVSNSEDVTFLVNLTSKPLFAGNNTFEIDTDCYNYDINVSLGLTLTNSTTVFYSCSNENPSNYYLNNHLIFLELIVNDSDTIEGDVKFIINFNNARYFDLDFWVMNYNFVEDIGVWEKLEGSQKDIGYFVINYNHLSVFAISEGKFPLRYNNFIPLIIIISFLSLSAIIILRLILRKMERRKLN